MEHFKMNIVDVFMLAFAVSRKSDPYQRHWGSSTKWTVQLPKILGLEKLTTPNFGANGANFFSSKIVFREH